MDKVNNDTIGVVLVDDQPVFSAGLKEIIKQYPNIELLGDFTSGKDAMIKINKSSPDIVLIGLNKPYMNGFADIKMIRKKLPRSKILILSIHDDEGYILEIIRLGAMGYIMKDSHPEEIIKALERIHKNNLYYTPQISDSILKKHRHLIQYEKKSYVPPLLTSRETDVLYNVVNGLTSKEIGKKLGISVRTVETHREHIIQKLNIKTVAGLTKYAISIGLINIK